MQNTDNTPDPNEQHLQGHKQAPVKTLVILTPGFAASETDDTCLPPRQVFVKALKRLYPDWEIIILAFHYPFRQDSYQWFGIKVISFNGRDWGKLFRLHTWWKVWRKLKELHELHPNLHLLSFWLGECAFVGHKFSKKFGVKHLIWMLGQDAKPGNRFFKRVRPEAEHLISLSDAMSDLFYKSYHIRPKNTLPVGIAPAQFSMAGVEREIDILGAGSLIPLKQYHLFIEAIHVIATFKPNIKAVICGKGPEQQQLSALIDKYQLNHNISLYGEVQAKQVLDYMQRSKIFLHTSGYEGFGSVLAEALYAGMQVVSFTKPMYDMSSHFHQVYTLQQMIDKLTCLLNRPKLDHQPVMLFSDDAVAHQLASLYL